MNLRTFALLLRLLAVAVAFNASSAYAQAWQNVVVKAGTNKTFTVPLGKMIEFLPPSGTPHVTSVKIEYSGENVVSFDGDTLLKPPTLLVGPIIMTVSVTQPAIYNLPACFLVVTYRLKVNK